MNNRENLLSMARILERTNRTSQLVDIMKQVVILDPDLTLEERTILSVAYKNLIDISRNGLRKLAIIEQQQGKNISKERSMHIDNLRAKILSEHDQNCLDVIHLADEHLLPAAKNPESRVFYFKLKADYYRYMCEAHTGKEKEDALNKAKECYESALKIARSEIPPTRPAFLGLIVNYSVFLFDVTGQKKEAIKLAKNTYDECSAVVDENNSESYSEATMILQLLRDNVYFWGESDPQLRITVPYN